jgi:hypothetical protein
MSLTVLLRRSSKGRIQMCYHPGPGPLEKVAYDWEEARGKSSGLHLNFFDRCRAHQPERRGRF